MLRRCSGLTRTPSPIGQLLYLFWPAGGRRWEGTASSSKCQVGGRHGRPPFSTIRSLPHRAGCAALHVYFHRCISATRPSPRGRRVTATIKGHRPHLSSTTSHCVYTVIQPGSLERFVIPLASSAPHTLPTVLRYCSRVPGLVYSPPSLPLPPWLASSNDAIGSPVTFV